VKVALILIGLTVVGLVVGGLLGYAILYGLRWGRS
jgi:hypothetical protein